MDRVRWGILGTGYIAERFVGDLNQLDGAEVSAVGSRHADSANRFGEEFGIPRRHASYADLARDPGVDVVYVATPHVFHEQNSALCLNNGKAVLCEKPLTVNAAEAARLVALAREKNLFLMEGMWTRFFPLVERVRALISEGAIGEPRMLTADFGYRDEMDPSGRKFNPELGGGALLDVGVYCVSLASMIFGEAREVTGSAHLGQTGVDEQSAAVLKYGDGQLAILSAAIRTRTPQEAIIAGTEGFIRIHHPWWRPNTLTLSRPGEREEIERVDHFGTGFAHEILEVESCLQAGLLESNTMPLSETLATMTTMDELRSLWNLRYPGEEQEGQTEHAIRSD